MAFNKITDTLNVHEARANRPTEDATVLKALFDQDVNTVKDRFNEHIDELSSVVDGSTGANNIGIKASGVVATNVNDAVAEVQANVADAVGGTIPDGTLTEAKMADEMKKIAGGVYPYDDGEANASDIITNANDIQTNADAIAEIEEIRVSTDTTGSANAYVLDTGNNFDFTLDGNVVRMNPNFTCTGSSTIAVDGTTKFIRKFDIETDSYVVLEDEDIKKNNSTELRFDVSEDFFVLAPKQSGGSNVKSVQQGRISMDSTTKNITINSVDTANAIVDIKMNGSTGSNDGARGVTGVLTSSTNLELTATDINGDLVYQVIEYQNVKSIQSGTTSGIGTSKNQSISTVDKEKSVLYYAYRNTNTAALSRYANAVGYLSSDTNIYFVAAANITTNIIQWYVVEFN